MVVGITGATGFIGRRVVARLREKHGLIIRVLSRKIPVSECQACETYRIDLTAPGEAVRKFMEGTDVIVHCAGELGDPSRMESLHVNGTAALLEAAACLRERRRRPLHWVQLSSVGVYGPPVKPGMARVIREDAPTNPSGDYEQTKARADELVAEASSKGFITFTTVRPSIVFGSDMRNDSLRQLAKIVRAGLFAYVGKRGAIANYVHVDDVADVLMRAVGDERMHGQIYNLSNDCPLEEMIRGVAAGARVRTPRLRMPEQPMRALLRLLPPKLGLPLTKTRFDALVSRTGYPCDKLFAHIGYKPARSVPQAMASVVFEWFSPRNEPSSALSGGS